VLTVENNISYLLTYLISDDTLFYVTRNWRISLPVG